MPDSFSSDDEGPDPYVGQDLDGLLSGEDRCVPEALRPVVPALDALRAAAAPAELRGEAAARAYFRKVMLADEARTLILSAGPPGSRPPVMRHRHRRPSQRGRWRAKALAVGAAAAVVIIGGVSLGGAFSGSGGHPATVGRGLGETSAATPANGQGAHGVDGSGTPEPRVKPTPTATTSRQPASGPTPSDLCSEYFDFFTHPGQHASQATEHEVFRQLSSLAGGPGSVGDYCLHLVQLWSAPPGGGTLPGMPGFSYPDGSQRFHGPQGPQGDQNSQNSQNPQNPQNSQGSHGSQNSQGSQGSQNSQGSQGGGSPSWHGGSGNNGGGGNGGGNGNGRSGIGPAARVGGQR